MTRTDSLALTTAAIRAEMLRRFRPEFVDYMMRESGEMMARNRLYHWGRRPWTRPPWQTGRRKSIGDNKRKHFLERERQYRGLLAQIADQRRRTYEKFT